jgi:hypothetical protein
MGVGLSIVRRLCDRFGWTIDIVSERGYGTVVAVHLQSAKPGDGKRQAVAVASQPESAPSRSLHQGSVTLSPK